MYCAPKSAWKPLYPCGSDGSESVTGRWALAQIASPFAQWIASPTYLATWTSLDGSGFAAVSAASADAGPNTVGTSTAGFSSTMFAVEKSPTVQPARVNGTHGAGVTRFGAPLPGDVSEYTIEGAV